MRRQHRARRREVKQRHQGNGWSRSPTTDRLPKPPTGHRRRGVGKLYLEIDEVTDDLLAEPFDGLVYRRNLHRTSIAHRRRRVIETTNGAPRDAAVSTMSTSAALLERIARGEGSSKATMVELRGFEPLTPSMRTRCAAAQR